MRYAIGMLRNQILAFIFRPPAGKAPPKVRLIMSLGKKIVKRKAMGPKAFQPLAGPWRKFFQKLLDFLLTNGPGFSILTKPSQERGASREHSSAGRAHALQAWGHRFEPCCSHHFFLMVHFSGLPGSVVQLVRTPACHAGGRGFKSLPSRHLPL